jgi:hypothetical protein
MSMLFAAWAGAFGRAVSTGHWHAFMTLDGVTLLAVSAQAARYQSLLLPVFVSWAALLLLTPARHVIAFRVAVAAAGILGYLRLAPPPFLVTGRVVTLSHWLAKSASLPAIPYLISAIALSYVLLTSAIGNFGRLDYLHRNAHSVHYYGSPSLGLTRRFCAALLILLVLLLITWAVIVIRLSASRDAFPAAEILYGRQGALQQSNYLFSLALLAAVVAWAGGGWKWLIPAMIVTAAYGLAPGVLSVPPILRISTGREQLIKLGMVWGGDSLWAALFVFIPAAVFGIYLVDRLLRTS